jgi:uncharacterized protein (DUF1501 family)
MNRRTFLKAAAGAAAGLLLPLGGTGWAFAAPTPARKRLIVVFLRGAVDGLSVLVPYAEPAYYAARPTIAVPRPGTEAGAIALADGFGLHPALGALLPHWRAGRLAFVHGCGLDAAHRSHFEAQDLMEIGAGGGARPGDGWLNRLLGALPAGQPHQGVALGPVTPRIVTGPQPVATMPTGPGARRQALDRPAVQAAFDRLYAGTDPIAQAYRDGRAAREALLADLDGLEREQMAADNGAPDARGFVADARQLARLMATDPAIRVAFLGLGGWDTHVNQGPQLQRNLKALGDGLAALASGLGPAFGETAILVMSEFGRTARENGNGGTDHGYGNAMWVLGGGVAGGRFHGRWPGLGEAQLYQGRDLAVTTDYRAVAAAVLQEHMGLSREQVGQVFPGLGALALPTRLFRA